MSNTKINTLRSLLLCVATFASFFALFIILNSSVASATGINEQINFQGRLFTSEGATVPDGFYNIQFKIYSGGDGQTADNPGGTLLWTEDRLNDSSQGVTVRNGFLSVSLGSVTPFGSSIDWNNDTLWLSINIAGTGTECSTFGDCGPDGEMLPMKRLTATPYSLNSAMLGGIPSGGFLQLAQGMQTDSAAGASIQIDKTGSGDFMHLQADGIDVFHLTRAGNVVFGGDDDHSISVAEASTGEGRSLTVSAGAAALGSDLDGGDLVLRGGEGDGVGEDGAVRVESILELSVLGSADNDTIVCHNSANQLASCISDFATQAFVTLQNAYDNGGTIQTSAGSGNIVATLANDTTDPNFLIDIESGSTGRFAVQDDGTDVLGVTSSQVAVNGDFISTGNFAARAGEDGSGTFQVQNSNGAALLSVDTSQSGNVVANSGAEDASTFSTDWTEFHGSGTSTVTRNDSDPDNIASGLASVRVDTTDAAGVGVSNNLASSPDVDTAYMVSFSAKLGSGSAFNDIEVVYSHDGGTTITACDGGTYSTREVVASEWRKISCVLTTPVDTVSDANLIIRQESAPGGVRTFYIDNLSMVAHNTSGTQNTSVLRVGGATSQGLTLFTLDRYANTPFEGANAALAGSMYFDTTQNLIQCYDGISWSACGATPDSNITLTPEYAGAVLDGGSTPGVGVLSAGFCSNDVDLNVGDLCSTGESRNYYQWTSPQSSMQTYSIYVTHKLPPTFNNFASSDTIRLTWLTDSAGGTDGTVTYQVFRKSSGGGVTSCDGTNESTEASPTADVWHTTVFEGNEQACGFTANDHIIFKINVSSRNNANVYVENINFAFTNR